MRFLFRLGFITVIIIVGLAVLGHFSSQGAPCLTGVKTSTSSALSSTGSGVVAGVHDGSLGSEVGRGFDAVVSTGRGVVKFVRDLTGHRPITSDAKRVVNSAVNGGKDVAGVAKNVTGRRGVARASKSLVRAAGRCISATAVQP